MRNLSAIILLSLFLFSCSTTEPQPGMQTIPTNQVPPKPAATQKNQCKDARQPTPIPGEASLFPQVTEQDHILGSNSAYVTVLVYSDFQCLACAKLAPLLHNFISKYPGEVRLVFRHFPLLSMHDKAGLAVQATEAAQLQGKFWETHDLLFEKQADWINLTPSEFQLWLNKASSPLNLDTTKFIAAMDTEEIKKLTQLAWENGNKINLPGSPVILINGEIIKWNVNLLDQLEGYVKLALLKKHQYSTCPPHIIHTGKQYFANLNTTKGTVRIKLFGSQSPITVNNFVFLAQEGWYNGNPFHIVLPGIVVQTGDPTGTGFGGPGYFIENEKNSLMFDKIGMVGMINTGPDTNGSQFFIALAPTPAWNQRYTIFGEVVSGFDVLEKLNPTNLSGQGLAMDQMDTLINITVDEP
jgi:cyclophilin family peptidyl-prolyl cis-trans isomerase/protein-disulfide isomerase